MIPRVNQLRSLHCNLRLSLRIYPAVSRQYIHHINLLHCHRRHLRSNLPHSRLMYRRASPLNNRRLNQQCVLQIDPPYNPQEIHQINPLCSHRGTRRCSLLVCLQTNHFRILQSSLVSNLLVSHCVNHRRSQLHCHHRNLLHCHHRNLPFNLPHSRLMNRRVSPHHNRRFNHQGILPINHHCNRQEIHLTSQHLHLPLNRARSQ